LKERDNKGFNNFEGTSHKRKYRCRRVKIVTPKDHKNNNLNSQIFPLLVVQQYKEKTMKKMLPKMMGEKNKPFVVI
jgi:hypothetical protein